MTRQCKSKTDIGERRKLIGQIADVIDPIASSLARTLTQEKGKPLPDVPFGGAKNLGICRELGEEDLAELTQLQVINFAI